MTQSAIQTQSMLKYELEISDHHSVELRDLPFAAGARVVVYVQPAEHDEFSALAQASESSLGFWDNPLDDEDWNNA